MTLLNSTLRIFTEDDELNSLKNDFSKVKKAFQHKYFKQSTGAEIIQEAVDLRYPGNDACLILW